MKWTAANLRKTLPLVIAKGETSDVIAKLAGRFYSNKTWYLLRRDARIPFTAPPAKIPINVRPVERADFPVIVAERPARLPALEAGLATCYVAVTGEGAICYMQWLVDSSQNRLIEREFTGMCPRLNGDEMMLEWAYTFKQFRGLGVMAPAMATISAEGAKRGARWLITYVEHDNIPSLRGCRSAGYRPYKLREDQWRMFRKSETFVTLPADACYPFEGQPIELSAAAIARDA